MIDGCWMQNLGDGVENGANGLARVRQNRKDLPPKPQRGNPRRGLLLCLLLLSLLMQHLSSIPKKKRTMTKLTAAALAMMASSAMAFAPSDSASSSSALKAGMPDRMWDQMVDPTERSASLPWLPRAKALDGSMAGDVGFDPFYLSSIPKNFAGFIQPPSWENTEGIETLYWMREAELKHSRVAMMAWFGWLATDGAFGVMLRFPGDIYSVESIPTAYNAHDILVEQGSMSFLLLCVAVVEFCSGAALVQVSKGELDRPAGDFGLDPLQFLKNKTDDEVKRMQTRELLNGRLAMLAFSAVATQTALEGGNTAFPYF